MPNVSFAAPTDAQAEAEQIARSRKYAEMLQAQSMQPLESQSAGGWVVPISPTQGIAKIFQAYSGRKGQEFADEKQKALAQRLREQGLSDVQNFTQALQGQQAKPFDIPANEMDSEATTGMQKAIAPDRQKALAIALQSKNPMVSGAGSAMLAKMLEEKKPVVVGRSLLDPTTGKPVGIDSTWKDEQEAARLQREQQAMEQRTAREREQSARLEDQRLARQEQAQLRRDLAAQASADRRLVSENARQDRIKPPAGYRFTPEGNLEQIPGGPADQKTQQRLEGGGTVDNVVASLRDQYDQLDKKGGITNPDKGVIGNIAAGISSSGVGQAAGKLLGTETQSMRNTIAQQRPLLLQAIMKATGMSAKQMDSNAELKLYLATATDPTLDVSANKRALDMIEKLYGSASTGKQPDRGQIAQPGGWSIQKVQ